MRSDTQPRPEALPDSCGISTETPGFSTRAAADFPFLLPAAYARKIENSSDPGALARQVLPVHEELLQVPGYSRNPLLEAAQENGGLIEKYKGRLLVMVTNACSGHCRFCFRRHQLDNPRGQGELQAAFRQRMQERPDITEVILSGGDPLVLSDRKLAAWFELAGQYPQLRRIRIHTREPVFSPQRITPQLGSVMSNSKIPLVVAVHVNHADELDDETRRSIAVLRQAGATLLTQTVLLRGVNDSVETLQALYERALECSLTPYYLHQLDKVAGAAHFRVDTARSLELVGELRDRLPGYLVPRFVQEVPGEKSKVPLG